MTKCNSDCAISKHHHDFSIPKELLEDLLSDKVVIFAGAGISTESRNVLKFTFYEDVALELGITKFDISFPDLMEMYCAQANGRIKLLSKIRKRFEHIRTFPEMERTATMFHRELSTIYPLKTIITTNWDMYFEDKCDAVPFVTDQDLAFWESDERRVLKIHGSINNYGSIVATTKDYADCQERLHKGVIGSILKSILATKTVIFVGYSLSDPDFINIRDFVCETMKGLNRQAYVITPFEQEKEKFEKLGIMPIITDGTYFLTQIKKHLVETNVILPDSIYNVAGELFFKIVKEHELLHDKYKCFDHPQMIFAASYQDGMCHALERVGALKNSGHYSNKRSIVGVIHPYVDWQKRKLKQKLYEDVAYIQGYINALMYLGMDEEERSKFETPPLYYAFGVKEEMYTLEDYSKWIDELPALHKASYQTARKFVDRLKSTSGVAFHHPPWL